MSGTALERAQGRQRRVVGDELSDLIGWGRSGY